MHCGIATNKSIVSYPISSRRTGYAYRENKKGNGHQDKILCRPHQSNMKVLKKKGALWQEEKKPA